MRRLGLSPRAMSGSMVQLQLGSLLMSVALVTTKGQADIHGLGCHRDTFCSEWPVVETEAMGTSRLRLLLGAMSGLWSCCSVYCPDGLVTTKGHADILALCCCPKLC